MNKSQFVFSSLVIVMLSSCAAGPLKLDGITTDDASNSALIKEQGSTMGFIFSGFTTPITGSMFTTIVESIDGKKVSANGPGRDWRLVPGKHTLGIRCHHIFGFNEDTGTGSVEIDVVSGRTYQLESMVNSNQCVTNYKEITVAETSSKP